ncbi:Tetratricopeptide repeat-like superfamily protein isoform 1 [Hibiscus syriacus]|uniref:Tetratricopeptide repeat-like superfamily protein isoform 1 n=1 Tax=Hibiscus syriacus TaxID=106335 RepID=A0A6A3CQ12_HIBSY|nr:Tetratricopeptide repeat-like superfamily protein isoform 1 [Hibiscus syriacus]
MKNAVRCLWARRSNLNLVGAHINVFTGEWTQKDAGIGTSIDSLYVEVNMDSAAIVWPLFNSLQAFWPGLQVLAGDIDPAIRTHAAFFSVWKRYGFTPEGFNLSALSVQLKYLWLLFDLAVGPDNLVERGPYKLEQSGNNCRYDEYIVEVRVVRYLCCYAGWGIVEKNEGETAGLVGVPLIQGLSCKGLRNHRHLHHLI